MLYVDTSALLKRYVDEPESDECERLLLDDPAWVSARHTLVEARRNLARLLRGKALHDARASLAEDLARTYIVELDEETCSAAAVIAETTGARTLDALHLAAARRAGGADARVITYDARMRDVARGMGLRVVG